VKFEVKFKSGEQQSGGFVYLEDKDYEYEEIRKPSLKDRLGNKCDERKAKNNRTRKSGFQVLAELAKSSMSQRLFQDVLWAQGGDLRASFLGKLQKEIDIEMGEKLPLKDFGPGVDGRWIDCWTLVELILPSLLKKMNLVLSGDGRTSGNISGVVMTLKIVVMNQKGKYVSGIYLIVICHVEQIGGSILQNFRITGIFCANM
jgi:hypothetical protein